MSVCGFSFDSSSLGIHHFFMGKHFFSSESGSSSFSEGDSSSSSQGDSSSSSVEESSSSSDLGNSSSDKTSSP